METGLLSKHAGKGGAGCGPISLSISKHLSDTCNAVFQSETLDCLHENKTPEGIQISGPLLGPLLQNKARGICISCVLLSDS